MDDREIAFIVMNVSECDIGHGMSNLKNNN